MSQHDEPECLFCKMAAREIPTDIVAENEHVLAFRDIEPQAPSHVLVIPKMHVADVGILALQEPETCAAVMQMVAQVGRAEGGTEDDAGYRTVFNTGTLGGQLIFHCHAHVLAGRQFGWPPG